MNPQDKKTGAAQAPASCDPSCACPPANDNVSSPAKPRGFLRRIFGKCAACAGSGAAGFIVGHAGCVITPMVIAAVGVTTATAGVSMLALAFSAAATAGGIYAWHKLRGKTAPTFEKRLVIGSAITGLLASTIMMNLGGHEHHGSHQNHQSPTPQHQMHDGHQGHGAHSGHQIHGAAVPANDSLPPQTAAFYGRLDAKEQARLRDNAAQMHMSLPEYLGTLCITPATSAPADSATAKAPVRMAAVGSPKP